MPNDSTRRNLLESAEWVENIYQLEKNDLAEAGPDGIMNQQPKELANRTAYLKKKLEELAATVLDSNTYDELLRRINALDAASEDYRINHLERLIGNLYQDIQAAGIDPDGYDNALFETFADGADEIDQTVVTVKSVVSGDDSIDVEDSSNLIIGAHYQLTDGEKTEEVQVKSINVSGSIKRVVLYENVKNQYTEGRTKLYRSSIAIYNGRAYGGGNTSTQDINGTDTFSGSNTKKSITSTLNLSSADGLSLDGAEVSDGKVIIGGRVIGVALMSDDGGTWKQVDEEGDALV